MKILLIFNHAPYDANDITWNELRLADKLVDAGSKVRLFLMNEAVDMARDACAPACTLLSCGLPHTPDPAFPMAGQCGIMIFP